MYAGFVSFFFFVEAKTARIIMQITFGGLDFLGNCAHVDILQEKKNPCVFPTPRVVRVREKTHPSNNKRIF